MKKILIAGLVAASLLTAACDRVDTVSNNTSVEQIYDNGTVVTTNSTVVEDD